jgi:hypothetical protein
LTILHLMRMKVMSHLTDVQPNQHTTDQPARYPIACAYDRAPDRRSAEREDAGHLYTWYSDGSASRHRTKWRGCSIVSQGPEEEIFPAPTWSAKDFYDLMVEEQGAATDGDQSLVLAEHPRFSHRPS